MKVLINYFELLWELARKERKRKIKHFVKEVVNTKNIKLLDCGCDDGKFTEELRIELGLKEVYGIEISSQTVKRARKRKIKVKQGDLNKKFPFSNNYFDVVISDQVIEHLYDLDNFLGEIHRVLKPGGYVLISTENLSSWHNVAALFFGLQPFTGPTPSLKFVTGFHPLVPDKKVMRKKRLSTLSMPSHTKVLTVRALRDLIKAYNFKIEVIEGYGYLPASGFFARLMNKIDVYHSLFMTIKAKK